MDFPKMDPELLERAIEESRDDLDLAIRSLKELHLGSVSHQQVPEEISNENLPKNGADWVEFLVSEMTSASDVEDAKSRASRVLKAFGNFVHTRASSDAAQSFPQESEAIKAKFEALIHENTILKRAVTIQHERQKQFENKNLELQQLQQLLSQYQDQLRALKVNNYALNLHLKQAQNGNNIPGHFHPDLF